MDRILAMSLVGTGPGNIFGPGMSAGVLESFARDEVRAKKAAEGGNSRGGAGVVAGGTRSTSAAGSGGNGAAEKEANNNGASASLTRSCPCSSALDVDQRFCFVDAVVAPY